MGLQNPACPRLCSLRDGHAKSRSLSHDPKFLNWAETHPSPSFFCPHFLLTLSSFFFFFFFARRHEPGVPCTVKASRLVSSIKKLTNDENDMDFGRHTPLELDLHLDNFQLIPTERGTSWLEISHILRISVHFMDVNLESIVTELPLFVDHEPTPSSIAEEEAAAAAEAAASADSQKVASTKKSSALRMLESLTLSSSTVSPVS